LPGIILFEVLLTESFFVFISHKNVEDASAFG